LRQNNQGAKEAEDGGMVVVAGMAEEGVMVVKYFLPRFFLIPGQGLTLQRQGFRDVCPDCPGNFTIGEMYFFYCFLL